MYVSQHYTCIISCCINNVDFIPLSLVPLDMSVPSTRAGARPAVLLCIVYFLTVFPSGTWSQTNPASSSTEVRNIITCPNETTIMRPPVCPSKVNKTLYILVSSYVCMYVLCMHVWMYVVCVYVCVYVCLCGCMCVCVCMIRVSTQHIHEFVPHNQALCNNESSQYCSNTPNH